MVTASGGSGPFSQNEMEAAVIKANQFRARRLSRSKEYSQRSKCFGGPLFGNEMPAVDGLLRRMNNKVAPTIKWLEQPADDTARTEGAPDHSDYSKRKARRFASSNSISVMTGKKS